PIYFTAKRAVEGLIGATLAASSAYKFFNCADGAAIEGSTWITEAQFNDTIIELGDKNEKARVLIKLFSNESQAISLENLENTLDVTCEKLSQLAKRIEGMIKSQRVRGKKDITRLSSEISRYLEGELIKSDPGFYYMIRGAVRHHLYAGFA